MKYFKVFILFFILSCTGFAQAAEYALPKGLILALPVKSTAKVEWVAPPLAEKQVAKAGFSELNFRLGPNDSFWMGHDQKFFTDLSTGFGFHVDRQVSDFIFLRSGALFIVTDSHLGFAAAFKENIADAKAVLALPFQPICVLPLSKCAIAGGAKDEIFIYGYDPKSRTYAIFEAAEKFSVWRKIFSSKQRILAVYAHENNIYAAAGRLVFKIPRAGGEGKIIFSHPMENIESLAVTKRGVFYATHSGVGNVSEKGALEFMKANNCRLLANNNRLYVVLPDSLGILQFSNTGPQAKR